MKQKFYTVICAILIALSFSNNIIAQSSMLSGMYPGATEKLLGVRYRKLSTASTNQSAAVFTGIPDLSSNRGTTRADGDLVYGNSGSYVFALTYNPVTNSFVTATTIAATNAVNTFSGVSNNLRNDGKNASATAINLMTITVRSASSNSITISNLTIDGVPVTGSYGRSNASGVSNWYIPSSALTNGFVVTGVVSMAGTMANGNEAQFIEFGFANSAAAVPGPLPVVWGGFAGKRANSSTIGLQWRTMQEQNASHYNIQRSEDGVHFRTIGMAMAQGTTSLVTDYNFDDKQATGSMYYYRLEQVDLDGTSNFSTIIKLGNGGKKTLVGGLGSNKILVQFFSNDNRNIRIVNNSGIILKQFSTASQQQTLDVNNLPTGVYALQIINSDGTSEVHRFVK